MNLKAAIRLIMTIALFAGGIHRAEAFSFALDSIAQMGKFPAFVIKTYRWGDTFFNGYDTTYVKGSGHKFNVKLLTNTWVDNYNFDLQDNMGMRLQSDPSTTVGVRLTYLAVSVGYDKNLNKFFGSDAGAKRQFSFGFNCSLFAFNMYWSKNEVGTKINKFGQSGHTFNPNLDFRDGVTEEKGINFYYFFNHKKYSQAAAFSFSRIQTRSQGSFFAGLSYSWQRFNFNFGSLPHYILDHFPEQWTDYRYYATSRDYTFKLGYGYNWVFHRRWLLAVLESPSVGLRHGYINSDERRNTFALSNQFKLSLIWNKGEWFAGLIGELNTNLIVDKDNSFSTNIGNISATVGYRFDIW